jgi:hypothetical protein
MRDPFQRDAWLSPDAPWRQKPPSERQEEFLRKYGLWQEGLTRGTAAEIIGLAMSREQSQPGYLESLREAHRDTGPLIKWRQRFQECLRNIGTRDGAVDRN